MGSLKKNYSCAWRYLEHAQSEDIFLAVVKRLQNYRLSWERWISICTNGAGAMERKHKGVLTRVS